MEADSYVKEIEKQWHEDKQESTKDYRPRDGSVHLHGGGRAAVHCGDCAGHCLVSYSHGVDGADIGSGG